MKNAKKTLLKTIRSVSLIIAATLIIISQFTGCVIQKVPASTPTPKPDAPTARPDTTPSPETTPATTPEPTPIKDKLICGVTDYPPMNYKDPYGEWIGFDTEFARVVADRMGMAVEFVEIEWSQKLIELETGHIDCIWNAFAANVSENGVPRTSLVDFSYSYILNQQCVVIRKGDKADFKTYSDLAGKTAVAKFGSAGEFEAKNAIGDSGELIQDSSQKWALIKLIRGTADCAFVDILLAQELVGTRDYRELMIADIELEYEVYAVGFKKGSDLTPRVNRAMKELFDEDRMEYFAYRYGLEYNLKLDTSFPDVHDDELP